MIKKEGFMDIHESLDSSQAFAIVSVGVNN